MPVTANAEQSCSVPGCSRPVSARGYCHGHVQRLYRLGDVVPEVPLGGAARVASARRDRLDGPSAER